MNNLLIALFQAIALFVVVGIMLSGIAAAVMYSPYFLLVPIGILFGAVVLVFYAEGPP